MYRIQRRMAEAHEILRQKPEQSVLTRLDEQLSHLTRFMEEKLVMVDFLHARCVELGKEEQSTGYHHRRDP